MKTCGNAITPYSSGTTAGDRRPAMGQWWGIEEEWNLAEELYMLGQLRNIAVFFKSVDERQLRDPGEQLKQVLAHKKNIAEGKRYLSSLMISQTRSATSFASTWRNGCAITRKARPGPP
jgi:hypothetical protein